MGLDDRDYMRNPGSQPASSGGGKGKGKGFSLDSGLLIGILLIAIAFAALIAKGFRSEPERDGYLEQLSPFESPLDPQFNGGYPQLDVNTATQEELLLLPWMTERIADGIIERRERSPFLLTDELFEVRGIGEINIEMFRLYLYGFEDAPKPRVEAPVDIPDA